MNEETENLNQTSESIPSFLQDGMESTQTKPRKKKDPEDIFNQDSSGSDEKEDEADEEENPMNNRLGPNYAYHRGLYTLNVAERVT